MSTASQPDPFFGSTLEERLNTALFRARMKPPAMGKALGVSAELVRQWLDPANPAQPRPAYVLAWAIETGVPVEALDPTHHRAGGRWVEPSDDPDDGEYAPRDSNPQPSDYEPLAA